MIPKENYENRKKENHTKIFRICHCEYPLLGNSDENGKSINILKHKINYKPGGIRKSKGQAFTNK